ncbi:MAG TPA: hypothetical protein DCW96_02195, partial [Stenotrophomonas sp.]|nr:hypothetical protein [Stenotrophomonas sp.]
MASFMVEVPFRAVQFFQVEASSPAEAKRKANEGVMEPGVEAIDWRVIHTYAATCARPLNEPTTLATVKPP